MVNYNRRWYVRAYDHLRQDIRSIRLDRMEQVKVLERVFTPLPDADPLAAPDDERPLQVRVLFSPEVVRWVREERSFYTVAEQDHPEGLLVTLQVRHEDEIVQWLLGWGAVFACLNPTVYANE